MYANERFKSKIGVTITSFEYRHIGPGDETLS